MIRKMAYVGFSYLLGLFFASFFIFEAALITGVCAVLISIAILIFKGKKNITCIVCSVCFLIGTIYYIGYDRLCYQKITAFDSQEVTVSGVLTDFKEYSGDRAAYFINGKINDSIKANIYCSGESRMCDIGDEITVKGIVTVPENSFTFDSLRYYKSKGYYLTMNRPEISITSANKLPLKREASRYRQFIHDVMSEYLDYDSLPLVDAILFGDKSSIDDDTETMLFRSGIGHIMAVSGMHLSIVCSMFWFILQFVNINKYVRFVLLLIPMLAFVMLSGASNSVIRAAIMLTLVYGSSLFNRRSDLLNSLGISVILLTADCPFTVMDASFLLSVAGVIGIGDIAPLLTDIIEKKRKIRNSVKTLIISAVVSAVVFPVCFIFFDEVSVVSPISNLVLIPICSVILICGVIAVFTGGLGIVMIPVMTVCNLCCKFVLGFSEMLGGFHFSYITVSNKFSLYLIIAVLLITIGSAIYFRKVKLTALVYTAACALCVISVGFYRFIPSDRINVAVLKKGSASSIVINDKKNAAVIDLNKGGLCADYVFQYLRRNGIYRIELIGLLVDGQASDSSYNAHSKLYDIGTVIYPKSYENAVPCCIDAEYKCYDDSQDAVITMPNYTIQIGKNNTVLIKVNGCEILAYDGRNDTYASGRYDILVEYAGQKPCETVEGNVLIFSDSKAEAVTNKDVCAYYGENVLIKICDNEAETEVLNCAAYY